ncbi:hypothetical protein [Mycobacteroides chelonae]|uniref:hypothetical protein n=1 Tax=Mycobacteroides chelonae TaxID=1774 RepID=UPI0008A8673E|nr:hypothetical protein [Mycobacteroides chelonae]OHU48144.1 hypothetical protein BKG81_11430 [Mycobacteroides chelonae]
MVESGVPPEAVLIHRLRTALRPEVSIREAARQGQLSEGRWRQIEKGYQQVDSETQIPVNAPANTLARMFLVVGADPDQVREVGRHDAADELVRILEAGITPAQAAAEAASKTSVHPMLNEGVPLELVAETLSQMLDNLEETEEHQDRIVELTEQVLPVQAGHPNAVTPDELQEAYTEAREGTKELRAFIRGQVVKMIATANPSNADEVIRLFDPLLQKISKRESLPDEPRPSTRRGAATSPSEAKLDDRLDNATSREAIGLDHPDDRTQKRRRP